MENKLLNATLNIVRQHGDSLFLDVSRPYAYTMLIDYDRRKILLKVATDADDMPTSALRDIKLLSEFLSIPVLGIVAMARGEVLEEGVVYKRDNVNFISLATLARAFRGELPVFVQIKGRRYAFVDGQRLREAREREGLSLGAVSEMLSVSRETVYRYEREELNLSEAAARALARRFGPDVLKRIDIFSSIKADPIDKASRAIDAKTYRLELSHPNGIAYEDRPLFILKDEDKREKTEELAGHLGVEVVRG